MVTPEVRLPNQPHVIGQKHLSDHEELQSSAYPIIDNIKKCKKKMQLKFDGSVKKP
jgi:hypothetical protein